LQLTTITDETRLVLANLGDRATGLLTPTVRLGVTGLARAGKTVFIAALVHNLVHGGRLPLFKSYAAGRVASARLEPQPDDHVPRFDYERHVMALVDERVWPESTRQISELRLTVRTNRRRFARHQRRQALLWYVDYPGEWLLDLPLLNRTMPRGRARRLASPVSGAPRRCRWLTRLAPSIPQRRTSAGRASLPRCSLPPGASRADDALSTQPPGRFYARRPRQLAGAHLRAAPPRERRLGPTPSPA
jgi:predicted YcjX-like family ATPase